MAMKIMPKVLPGGLHNLNKGSCDWGWQGLLAYGCQCCVVVVDPVTMQSVQVLDRHRGQVVKVKWARENYRHDLASPYCLRLASADINGKILVWDVVNGTVGAECVEGTKPIADMEWVSMQDVSHDLLVAIHPPSTLVLWNTENGSRLWKKTYNDLLMSFSFDPFDQNRLAFLGQDCVIFVDDFSLSKAPSSAGRKFYISSPTSQATAVSHSSSIEKLSEKRNSKSTIRRMSSILVGESNVKKDDETAAAECLQLAYHKACRHHLVLLYAREILILDLDINQTVSVIPMERSGSPFMTVIPLKQRDVMVCLHDNGSVALRVRRRLNHTHPSVPTAGATVQQAELDGSSPSGGAYDVFYDHRCQSDSLRVTKHNRVCAAVICPVTEKKIALIMSDGKTLVWELTTVDYVGNVALSAQSPLYTPGCGSPMNIIGDLLPEGNHSLNLGAISSSAPKLALSDLISHTPALLTESQANQNSLGGVEKHGVLLKFVLVGLLNGLAAPPVVLRMCPALTTKNFTLYQPLLAVGASPGIVQIYNLSSGQLYREFSMHSCTVHGIEWVSLRSFISFAHPTPVNVSGTVKNEIMLTDVNTGRSVQIRANADDECPIEYIRVSYLKQYFVILFKEKPFELWDLRTLTLLRQMPKNFPHVTALEWSPTHHVKMSKKRVPSESNGAAEASTSMLDLSSAATTPSAISPEETTTPAAPPPPDRKPSIAVREHFVFTDVNGLLYHFIVEGNLIKDGSKIPPDGNMGSITCIAWKAETLVLSDVDGNINLWDLKARISRAVPTSRGWIRKIKFAPGRGNMKLIVQYNDGVDVWDTQDVDRVACVRCPKDLSKVLDVEWAASDRPILACADGTIRITDITCSSGCSTMEDSQMPDPIFCPHILPPKASLTLKCRLQHQPWKKCYALNDEDVENADEITQIVSDQLYLLDTSLKQFFADCPFLTAQRCLLTAKLFGDESELMFWSVALHYLRAEKAEPSTKRMNSSYSKTGHGDLFVPCTPGREGLQDLVLFEGKQTTTSPGSDVSWLFIKDRSLETCYDVICDNVTFRGYQQRRVSLHDSKRATNEHTRKCAENLMLLGQADRAVQLLLETEPDSANYYADSLRACLVASIRSSGASQSTIKLVATNLIANGKLSEGVQLLCLIEKGLDACRYLQTYDQWDQAAWLAKVTVVT